MSADLRSLAAFRIVLASIVLMDLTSRAAHLKAHYTDEGVLPRVLLLTGNSLSEWRWSLNLANGTVYFQALFFGITALAALALLVGYRTRLMTIIVWVMVVSIQARNPLVLNAGDFLLRLLLFWGMLLPLGAWWSVDQRRRAASTRVSMRFLSFATIGLFLQISFMYWFTAALKADRQWREEGTALYYALGVEQLTTPLGEYLHQFPTLLKVLTFATLGLEVVAPILLFVPIFTGPLRTAAAMSIMSLHFGIYLTMDLGFFPWLSAFSMVCFFPSWFWDTALPKVRSAVPRRFSAASRRLWDAAAQPVPAFRFPLAKWGPGPGRMGRLSVWDMAATSHMGQLGSHLPHGGSSPVAPAPPSVDRASLVLRSSPLTNLFAAFSLVFIFGWNMTSVSDFTMPRAAIPIGHALGLYQRWDMFAPYPVMSTTWHVVVGRLQDGRQIDALTPIIHDDLDRIQEPSWEQPDNISRDLYRGAHWRKYWERVVGDGMIEERRAFAAYVCRTWNAHHADPSEKITGVQIFIMVKRTLPDYQESEPVRSSFTESRCG